jgi:hypothetical protein
LEVAELNVTNLEKSQDPTSEEKDHELVDTHQKNLEIEM